MKALKMNSSRNIKIGLYGHLFAAFVFATCQAAGYLSGNEYSFLTLAAVAWSCSALGLLFGFNWAWRMSGVVMIGWLATIVWLLISFTTELPWVGWKGWTLCAMLALPFFTAAAIALKWLIRNKNLLVTRDPG